MKLALTVKAIENGALLGWLFNPQQRQVEIYRPFIYEIYSSPR